VNTDDYFALLSLLLLAVVTAGFIGAAIDAWRDR